MRFWLIPALVLVAAALTLGANLVLLGYAQPRNDPVGQLTPAQMLKVESPTPSVAAIDRALSPKPSSHEHVHGRQSDD
jgi:hypothetical protein